MPVYSHAQIQNLLRQAGWQDKTVSSSSGNVPLIALMSAITMGESSGDSNNRNPKSGALNPKTGELSIGLLQINIAPHLHRPYKEQDLYNPLYNLQVALKIYNQQGLRAWGAYTDGRYKTHLQAAQAAYSGNAAKPNLPVSNYDAGNQSTPNYGAILLLVLLAGMILRR